MLITETKEFNISGMTISVPISISIDATSHSNKRFSTRNISQEEIIEVLHQALPSIIQQNLNKPSGIYNHVILDAQTCIIICFKHKNCMKATRLKQNVIVKTSYIFDGKSPLPQDCLIINKDNPSDEFIEAEQNAEWYGHTFSNGGDATHEPEKFVEKNFDEYGNPLTYKAYMKYYDSERPNIAKKVKQIQDTRKSQQIAQMYADRQKELDAQQHEIDKKKEFDSNLLWRSKHKWDKEAKDKTIRFRDWVRHDTKNALQRADKEILTPYGPNGSLRGIDRKRKKLAKNEHINKSELNYIINETVNRILKTIKGE